MSTLAAAAKQVSIYSGIATIIAGTIGGLLNIVVFLSLRTFRESSCALYLNIMSMVNLVQLWTGVLSRVAINLSGVDWTQTSVFYCKFRQFLIQWSSLTSATCLYLATIDQCFATATRARWQKWSDIRVARRLILGSMIIWTLHGVPYLIYSDHVPSAGTGRVTCSLKNYAFAQYRSLFAVPILTGFLPIGLTIVFGILTYCNVQTIAYRTIPLVRRELDKQLTVMVLTQVLIYCFSASPFVIVTILLTYTNLSTDPVLATTIQSIYSLTVALYYTTFAVRVD